MLRNLFQKKKKKKLLLKRRSGMVHSHEESLVWSYYQFFGSSVLSIDTSFIRHEHCVATEVVGQLHKLRSQCLNDGIPHPISLEICELHRAGCSNKKVKNLTDRQQVV